MAGAATRLNEFMLYNRANARPTMPELVGLAFLVPTMWENTAQSLKQRGRENSGGAETSQTSLSVAKVRPTPLYGFS